MKGVMRVFAILAFGAIFSGNLNAQFCGTSTRSIKLEYPDGADTKTQVKYDLFYLAPKNKTLENDSERIAFLSEFLYGDPAARNYRFWIAVKKDETFVELDPATAEEYISNYKPEAFEAVSADVWHKHHIGQLKGAFINGFLELKTGEMDDTVFIMRVSSGAFETQYLVSSFLGGCFAPADRHPQQIIMNPASK